MADVFDNISSIRTAHFGRDVRTAIADSIEQCYAHATGDPNSLSSIIKALAKGVTTGEVVYGEHPYSDNVTVDRNSYTRINTILLPPGTWLLLYNAAFDPANNEDAHDAQITTIIRTTHTNINTEVGFANSQSYGNVAGTLHVSMCGSIIITVESDDETLVDGAKEFWLYMTHYATNSATANSIFYAVKIGNELDSDEETSVVEQVAENTAAIANLQSLGTDISSIQSQHENDIDELTDLIEDSVVSLRASLDEKTFSLDENDYLTLD